MSQFHVFYKNGEMFAVDTTGAESVERIEAVLSLNGWNGSNWYGSLANSPDAAIEEAKKNNFLDVSAEEMANKLARLKEFL